ncbi:putative transcription elongation factor SPT5-like 1 [Vitis vinifera]|uniref:Transcription elongation factor SPT5 n=1 Tax=Vitis vinifera TaxID=29760 RepID=A0A438HKJ7_VITVI|nr:putative transcription elongation factor SPT5-like 1 [Vitis vinifera]
MPRRRHDDDDDDLEPEEDDVLDDDEDYEDEDVGVGSSRKRSRSEFIDDVARRTTTRMTTTTMRILEVVVAAATGPRGGLAPSFWTLKLRSTVMRKRRRKTARMVREQQIVKSSMEFVPNALIFFDPLIDLWSYHADFIVDAGAELPDEDDGQRMRRRPLLPQEDEQEDFEALERKIQERYGKSSHAEYDEETTEVEQQALLPSVRDPKLWMVKCAIGHEREAAVCLMQKSIDKGPEVQIRSAIALDHLKNYIYIEADKEAHVKEACKGLRNIYAQKVMLVPIREMTDVLSVESKAVDLSRNTWVRMKIGTYKGDLAKVVDVDNVRQRVTVQLIPRIDLQALANKLEGREVVTKKAFKPPPRFMNVEEAREMHIRVERRRDPMTGDYFENIGGMMFKDGFLYKTVSMKSISVQNIQPTFDELEKFRTPGETGDGDMASLSTLFANRKKGHFMKGDAVIIVKGDLKNLKGWVEKVEEENVHIRPEMKGLPKTLAVNEKELCKYFEPGNHVKVVSGTQEGATGMVVKVEGHVLIILSDTTKEHLRVFADDVVESSEVTSGVTRIGDYELHDLVLLDNLSFGVIIRVEVKLSRLVIERMPSKRDKIQIDKRVNVQDRFKNTVSVKDVVRILDGPCKGKQGPVEHIYKGVLFIYDRHHLEHAGFICAKSHSCVVVGGSRSNADRSGDSFSDLPISEHHLAFLSHQGDSLEEVVQWTLCSVQEIVLLWTNTYYYAAGGRHRGGRGHDSLVGSTIKIRQGPFKGYRGRVVDVNGQSVRVELESQMKFPDWMMTAFICAVDRNQISDNVAVATPYRDAPRYGMGSETPMHPSRTPLHPYMTPMRDVGATPIHDGMRTPMRDRAWNPYAPMSPPRDNWEEGNPDSWVATSPQYQVSLEALLHEHMKHLLQVQAGLALLVAIYSEAGTPRDSTPAYANVPSPYLPSTPGGQPMTPNSVSYLPGTPGGSQ